MENINENKYPVKYAIMPIIRQLGYIEGYKHKIIANIVSKCYVIEDIKHYYEDGSYQWKYKVVFPFQEYDLDFNRYRREEPRDTNSLIVEQLFDNFEEALKVKNENNAEMIAKSYDNIGLKETQQIAIEKYKELEQQIEEETKDLIVTKEYNTSLDEIIEKIAENPRDFYIKIAEVLSIEEREYLKQLIENKSCMNCSNGTCRVETTEKTGNKSCIAWDNKELIGRQKILTKNNN